MCQLTELSTVKMVMCKEKRNDNYDNSSDNSIFLTKAKMCAKVRLQNIQDQQKAAEVKVNEADE